MHVPTGMGSKRKFQKVKLYTSDRANKNLTSNFMLIENNDTENLRIFLGDHCDTEVWSVVRATTLERVSIIPVLKKGKRW